MSLTVTCVDCRNPDNPRQIVQWRWGECRDCCDDFISRHLEQFPDHRLEVSGSISDSPFAVGESVRRLFGGRAA